MIGKFFFGEMTAETQAEIIMGPASMYPVFELQPYTNNDDGSRPEPIYVAAPNRDYVHKFADHMGWDNYTYRSYHPNPDEFARAGKVVNLLVIME